MDIEDSEEVFNSKWVKQEIIGSGCYGNVYRGIDSSNNEPIAIKKIKMPITDDGIPIETLREIVILRNVTHPNIVRYDSIMFRFHDVICINERMYLIFEYMEMDLKSFISNFGEKIPTELIKKIMKEILKGLSFIHLEGILHRDLKPQNILINYNKENNLLEVKLADFGLARTYSLISKNMTRYTSI
jgi:serine/threonine protein kinase